MFSIVIPTWNNLAHLQLVVRSIREHSAQPHQIVVHVNDGSDGSLAWVREQGLDHTASPSNIGICYAVNEAAMLARHEHLVYMNDDMYCLPGWDTALQRRAAAMPSDLYLLSGPQLDRRGRGTPCAVAAMYGASLGTSRETDVLRDAATLRRADWCGATWPPTLVTRRWWFRVGGYSTELSPGMSSDNDFSMKLWHAGCRHFIGVGDSLVYHFQQKSTGKVVKNDGRRQFLDKWGMTQSTFDRFYLRRGQPLAGDALPEPGDDPALRRALLKSRLRKRFG